MHALVEYTVAQKAARSSRHFSHLTQRRLFVAALALVDALTLVGAFLLAYYIRFNLDLPIFRTSVEPAFGFYVNLSLVLLPAWLVLLAVFRLYDDHTLLGGLQEYIAIFNACLSGTVIIAVVQFFVEELVVARGFVGLAWVLTFTLLTLERFVMRRAGYALRRRGYLTMPTLILGINGEGRMLGSQLAAWPTSGLNVLGYLDDDNPLGQRITAYLYVLGRLDRLDELIQRYQVTELVLVTSALPREKVLEIFQRYGTSRVVSLRMSSGLFDLLTTGVHVKEMGYVPLIGINQVRLSNLEAFFKRSVDIGVSLAALILGSWLLGLVALAVKLDSKGPVLFRRRVMGVGGAQFDALKFRTMHLNGDTLLQANPALLEELATTHKIKDDPRITRVGFFLRKFSLDELPQFINILRGEMSLVGPRMISPPELEKYGQWGMNLLTVRPGLTGLWQVSGRSDVSYEERVRLDMFYIRNYSIWLDFQLILRTIPVVLLGKGAY